MSAFVISSYQVVNSEPSWLPGPTVASIRAHGGEIRAADLTSEVLEGSAPPMTVIIRFADKSAARSWYESPDYQTLAPLRRVTATTYVSNDLAKSIPLGGTSHS